MWRTWRSPTRTEHLRALTALPDLPQPPAPPAGLQEVVRRGWDPSPGATEDCYGDTAQQPLGLLKLFLQTLYIFGNVFFLGGGTSKPVKLLGVGNKKPSLKSGLNNVGSHFSFCWPGEGAAPLSEGPPARPASPFCSGLSPQTLSLARGPQGVRRAFGALCPRCKGKAFIGDSRGSSARCPGCKDAECVGT